MSINIIFTLYNNYEGPMMCFTKAQFRLVALSMLTKINKNGKFSPTCILKFMNVLMSFKVCVFHHLLGA